MKAGPGVDGRWQSRLMNLSNDQLRVLLWVVDAADAWCLLGQRRKSYLDGPEGSPTGPLGQLQHMP